MEVRLESLCKPFWLHPWAHALCVSASLERSPSKDRRESYAAAADWVLGSVSVEVRDRQEEVVEVRDRQLLLACG